MWAFAKADWLNASVFAAVAMAAERRAGNFKPQGVSNTVWAFAVAGRSDAALLWLWRGQRSGALVSSMRRIS